MESSIFDLGVVQPKAFYGENNKHINLLKEHFSDIKIIARGSQLNLYGNKSDIEQFRFLGLKLLSEYERFESVSTERFEQILNLETTAELPRRKEDQDILFYKTSGQPLRLLNDSQHKFVNILESNDIVFALGPAGTGKTYMSVAVAVRALKNKKIRRIIFTKPAVEAGEKLGFLPGDVREKLDPYMQPLYDALLDMIPPKKLKEHMESGNIEIAPLAFMRGRTLDDAFVILDEAQNATRSQIKMFLTRMGKATKFVVTGDPRQVDLLDSKTSGLQEATTILKNIKGIEIMYLKEKDVVRHPLVKKIIRAYDTIK